ncbi:MAG: hypothetical protein KQI62_02080 [Deltaproteobacteria bacterium]|nr:hypothetical protein [Deltaproteobacteria bacterium]
MSYLSTNPQPIQSDSYDDLAKPDLWEAPLVIGSDQTSSPLEGTEPFSDLKIAGTDGSTLQELAKELNKETLDYSSTSDVPYEYMENWWKGTITAVDEGFLYFEAVLEDLDGLKSIARFSINRLKKRYDLDELKLYIFEGSTFAYYVLTKIFSNGRKVPDSSIEFSSPLIWNESLQDRAENAYKRLFLDGN